MEESIKGRARKKEARKKTARNEGRKRNLRRKCRKEIKQARMIAIKEESWKERIQKIKTSIKNKG